MRGVYHGWIDYYRPLSLNKYELGDELQKLKRKQHYPGQQTHPSSDSSKESLSNERPFA